MPGRTCAVVSCRNNQKSLKEKGSNIIFHCFPKVRDSVSSTICKKWIRCCRRADKFKVDSSSICSEHFTSNDYERDMKSELLGLPSKRTLKKTAVPTINLGRMIKVATEQTAREKRVTKRDQKRIVATLLASTSMAPSVNIPDSPQALCEIESLDATETKQPILLEDEDMDPEKNKNSYKKKNETLRQIYNSLTSRKDIKASCNGANVKEEEPDLEEIYNSIPRNIEIYIKEENIDIEENEIEPIESETSTEASSPSLSALPQHIKNPVQESLEKLEIKYGKLVEENEVLKRNFVKVVQEREVIKKENDLLKQSKSSSIMRLCDESVIDLTDMSGICRICLQKNADMDSIQGKINFENSEIAEINILDALASIGLDSIELGQQLPDKICFECKDLLVKVEVFKNAYKKKSHILTLYSQGAFQKVEKTLKTEDHDYHEYSPIEPENLVISPDNCEDESYYHKKPPHTCPVCFKELDLSVFRNHMHSHRALKKYLGGVKVTKKKKTRFWAPPRDDVGLVREKDKRHECPFCEKSYEASVFLNHMDDHMKNDHFTCDKCDRIFKKRSFLLQHMLVHSEELPYRCETCNKGFVVKTNYDCHLLTHTVTEDEFPHACEHCGKRFANPTHLRRHRTIHVENRSYTSKYKRRRCRHCLQGFNSVEMLTAHRCQSIRGVRGCRYCNKSFATLKTYQEHFQLVHKVSKKQQPRNCNQCGLTTTNMAYHKLKKHSDSVKRALCAVCGLYVTNIHRHRYTHSKPYKCPTCSKDFSHSTVLKKHMLIHTGLKPYICSYCGKGFNCTYNLQVHERIHKGEKKHVCTICDKGFLEKSYLKKHVKIHRGSDRIVT